MKSASLIIGKQVTLVVGGKVTTEKMGSFETVISNFNTIIFCGMSKPAKKQKYENLLTKAGFSVNEVCYSHNAGFEGLNSDVIDFRIEYTI